MNPFNSKSSSPDFAIDQIWSYKATHPTQNISFTILHSHEVRDYIILLFQKYIFVLKYNIYFGFL